MKNILNSHRKTEKILFRGVIMVVKRGDIFYADLSPVVGSEQGGVRPAITSKMNKAKLPTHIEIDCKNYCLIKDSVILLEQLRTIDKSRLREKVDHLEGKIMSKINKALEISLGLHNN